MNTYLIVKTLHILSATLMVGTGFGIVENCVLFHGITL